MIMMDLLISSKKPCLPEKSKRLLIGEGGRKLVYFFHWPAQWKLQQSEVVKLGRAANL